jgi:hypothetical protein
VNAEEQRSSYSAFSLQCERVAERVPVTEGNSGFVVSGGTSYWATCGRRRHAPLPAVWRAPACHLINVTYPDASARPQQYLAKRAAAGGEDQTGGVARFSRSGYIPPAIRAVSIQSGA